MTRTCPAAMVALAAVVLAAGCDCRPVSRGNWRDLLVQCDGQSEFGSSGSEQVVLDSQEAFDSFMRRDCLRSSPTSSLPAVDFTKEVVVVDVTFSPLSDGTCVGSRRVARVDACQGGVQMLFDDLPDPECASRPLTGSIAILRRDAQAAFSSVPEGASRR